MPGWSRIPSTTSRPPLTRLTTPGGSPSPSSTSKAICWVSGTCSEGLSTNVLPQPMAKGRNQNGTIAGKLKGTIAAHTPTGWRTVSASTLRGDVLEDAPLHRRRDRARGLDHLDHARRPRRGRRRSSCPSRSSPSARAPPCAPRGPRAGRTACARAADDADRAPLGQRGARGAHRGVEVRRRRQRHAGQHLAGGGVGDVELLGAGGRGPLPRRRSCRAGGWTGWWQCSSQHPFVVGVVGDGPGAGGAGHHVEVVEVVAGRRRDRVVAPGNEDGVAVAHRELSSRERSAV